MLPSPLNFQTPVGMNGPGFGGPSKEDDPGDKLKRKSPEIVGGGEGGGGEAKRVKT